MCDLRSIQVNTAAPYEVIIAPGLLADCGPRLRALMPPCHMAVITDSTVAPLYLDTVRQSLEAAGFASVRLTGDLTDRPPALNEDRWQFQAS